MKNDIVYTLFIILVIIIFVKYKIKQHDKSNQISKILPNIYVSSYATANNYDMLKKHNIEYILTILAKKKPFNRKMEYYSGIKYLQIDKHDVFFENIKNSFDKTYIFIDNAVSNNKNILIHCHAGISRSPTILAAYLMKKFCISRDNALEIIKNNRKIINPNFGFMNQLTEYENSLQECQRV